MDILRNYFAEHLDDGDAELPAPDPEHVLRIETRSPRYILFRIGQLRFALASTDVAAVTRAADGACDYLGADAIVPTRYLDAARVAGDHLHYIRLSATRFGIGPCCAEGEVDVPTSQVTPRPERGDEPWIVGTIADPPSLVLDRDALCSRLSAALAASAE